MIYKAARVIHGMRYTPSVASLTVVDESIAGALFEAGLLADPAQATELERLRAEAEKYHRYYDDAMKVRLDVEEVLDEALGTEEEDGAGYGLAGDVALLAQHEKAARAEADTLRGKVEELEAGRDERQARIDEHEELLSSIWLYVKWRYVTKQLTTEQKNLWADVVEKISERNHPGDGTKVDRWWQDDEPARAVLVGDQPRKPCEYVVSHWAGQEGSECIAMAEPNSDYCKPHGDALKALSGVAFRDVEEADDAAGDLP
jgi:hypothetical protein